MAADPQVTTIALIPDANEAMAMLASLENDLADAAPEFIEAMFGVLERGAQLFTFRTDSLAATGASECRVRFEPTDFLRRLVAAGRAGDFDLGIFKHELGSGVGVGSPIVAESEGCSARSPGRPSDPDTDERGEGA